jgi:N-hydroxyarylamine O-acetyltransferase
VNIYTRGVPSAFDLDAYLERIGYAGARNATLDTLTAIHALHPAAIPFENLNPLMGWPVALDIDSLQAKLVANGRGGWCFEHNILFRYALEAMGFSVTSLAARVLWNAVPGSPIGPRSHMLLLVHLAGADYVADVGFGGNVLTAPLRLEPHTTQTTPHESHRLLPLENGFVLQALLNSAKAADARPETGKEPANSSQGAGETAAVLRGFRNCEWKSFYRFTLEPQFPADYEVSNWYLCNHPGSFFRQTLLSARVTPEARYALRDNALAIHRKNETEKRTLASAAAIRTCLEMDFRLQLPESPELAAKLELLSQTSSASNASC